MLDGRMAFPIENGLLLVLTMQQVFFGLVNARFESFGGSSWDGQRWVQGEYHWPPSIVDGSEEGLISVDALGALYRQGLPDDWEAMVPDKSAFYENITCEGPLPPWTLPEFPEWNPNLATLQEICAKPKFLGKPPGPDGPRGIPGAYSLQWADRRLYLQVRDKELKNPESLSEEEKRLFKPKILYSVDTNFFPYPGTYPDLTGPRLFTPRLIYYCSQHCHPRADYADQTLFDLAGGRRALPPLLTQKPYKQTWSTVRLREASSTHRFRIENGPDFNAPLSSFVPNDRSLVPSAEVVVVEYPDQWPFWRQFRPIVIPEKPFIHISLHPNNFLNCDPKVALPAIPLPTPASWSDFSNARSLCATALSGGFEYANAGGFCRKYTSRDTSTGRPTSGRVIEEFYDVWFADEMTPRREWTWAENFIFAGNIRRYCWENCYCAGSRTARRQRPTRLRHNVVSDWSILDSVDIVRLAKGALAMASGGWDRYNPSQCVYDGVDYCTPKPWPTELLGPPPGNEPPHQSRLDLDSVLGLSSADAEGEPAKLPTCGATCNGPAARTCAPAAAEDDDCKCMLVPDALKRSFGLDPVAAVAMCLNAGALAAIARQRSRGGLRRRGLESRSGEGTMEVEVEEVQDVETWHCPCNGTYASVGCCGSSDGLVWEGPGLGATWG